jgi:alpha-tubulin suppressor-like RCC1 family protein
LSISNPVFDVCLGGNTLGAAIDQQGLLWTWGSNISGELGLGDTDPKVHPYPVMALKKKIVTQVACGSQFIVALGSNLKKEIPGLKLANKQSSVLRKSSNNHQRRRNDNLEGQLSNSQGSACCSAASGTF